MAMAHNLKNDTKTFYKYIGHKIKFREKTGPLVDATGQLESCNKEMADIFNQYFVSVFSKQFPNDIEVESGHAGPGIGDIHIDRGAVLKYMQRMGQNKAPGADAMYPRVLKEVQVEVVDALVSIVQSSIDTGDVPKDFECTNIVPIYKKYSHNEACNYRPVSLTLVVSKLLESVIRDSLQKYLEDNNLIGNTQHGFRKGRSSLTNLL